MTSKAKKYLNSKSMARKVRIRPFIYAVPSAGRTCVVTLCCLFVMILSLISKKMFWECALCLSSVLGSVLAALLPEAMMKNLLLPYKRHKRSRMLSAIVEGIIAAMILPSSCQLSTAFLLTFVFTLVAMNMAPRTSTFMSRSALNIPALVACSSWVVGVGGGANVLLPALDSPWDAPLTDVLNNNVFGMFGVTVPNGYMQLFADEAKGLCACCHFNAITILSSLVLFSCGMANGAVSAVFLFVYMALVRLAGPALFNSGDMVMAALTGGTLFCAVFVINRPGTLPMSRAGRAIYAVTCGVLAFFIAGPNPGIRSVPFAILCGNIISILIRYVEELFIDFADKRREAVLPASSAEGGNGGDDDK